jgi:hypothetical protein
MFCSPDLAVTIPAAAVFLSGATTSAYGECPETTVSPVINYPEAATVNALSDHVASTTDGKHIIGASANPAVLTDLSITVPINACPSNANGQTTGITFNPAPVINQTSLSAYGLNNINFVPLAIGLQYQALDKGTVNVATVFTTDGQLQSGHYVILTDTKHIFGFQNVAPLVSPKVVAEEGPAFAQTLNAVSAKLTTHVMQRLNAAVDIFKLDPATVASKFLQVNGLK